MIWKKLLKYLPILILSVILSVCLIVYPVNALSGKLDLKNAYNTYMYMYIRNQTSATPWESTTFGDSFYKSGVNYINGITFTTSISGPQYGSYTTAYYDFTLSGDYPWAVDGGDQTNFACEVWSTGTPRQISSTMYILKSYYQTPTGSYAQDYRCEFAASGLQPSYIFTRLGYNKAGTDAGIPYLSGGYDTGREVLHVNPRIRNVSLTYSTSDDQSNVDLGLVNQNLGDLINGQKNIYDKIEDVGDQINDSLSSLEQSNKENTDRTIDAIENQSKQEQEQYERDKQEEAEREQAGQDAAGELGGIFHFNIPNPFTGLFVLFTESNSCVSIPTISSMLGSPETSYCPWFSGRVREILTPVIGISASMLLFGFVIHGFLQKGNFSGGIEV